MEYEKQLYRVAEDSLAEYSFFVYFVLGTNWHLCCLLLPGDLIRYFYFSSSLVPVAELAFTETGLAFC